MRPLVRLTAAVAGALVLASAPAARAFDISGTWAGLYKCKGTFDGEKDSFTQVVGMIVTQIDSTFGAAVSFDQAAYGFTGTAIASATKPANGVVTLTSCDTDNDLSSGEFDELARLTVKTNPAKGTGTLSGTSILTSTDPALQSYLCKWKLKRTTPLDPGVPQTCL